MGGGEAGAAGVGGSVVGLVVVFIVIERDAVLLRQRGVLVVFGWLR